MLSIVKRCPKIIIIYSKSEITLMHYFNRNYNVFEHRKKKCIINNMDKVLSKASQLDTIVLLTDKLKGNVEEKDINQGFIVDDLSQNVLIDMMNTPIKNIVDHIRIGPEIVIMKNYGMIDKYLESINKSVKGVVGNPFKLLNKHNSGTVILLTNANINTKLSTNELYDKGIYTSLNNAKALKTLNLNGIKYINDSINKTGWNEYKIKIYDSYEQYTLHYNRLLHLIDFLNLGFILNESWGQDAGTIFKHVKVYEIYLYSPINKKDLKKRLVGLEYLENGERIIDLDLFLKRKKVKWSILKTKEVYSKENLGIYFRKELKKNLSKEQINILKEYEKRILKLQSS